MILAAGRGERMRPLTDTTPKPLLQVRGKALIDYHLEKLANANIERVVINHAWLGEQIVDHVRCGEFAGLDIVFSAESPVLETAGGIVKALPALTKDNAREFIVVNGDVFSDVDFTQLPDSLGEDLAHLVMVDNPEQHPRGDFYYAQGRLNTDGHTRLTYSGIGVYHVAMFSHLHPVRAPLAPLLIDAIEQRRVSAQHHQGEWNDVGTPDRLAALNQGGANAGLG